MKNVGRTGLAGWVLSICICFSQLLNAQSSLLKGRIYDAVTFAGVSHVNILIRNDNGDIITSITTNYSGLYQTDSIEAGTYRMEVLSRDYEKIVVSKLVLQPSKAAVFDIPLEYKKEETSASREDDEDTQSKDILEMLGGIVKNAALSGF